MSIESDIKEITKRVQKHIDSDEMIRLRSDNAELLKVLKNLLTETKGCHTETKCKGGCPTELRIKEAQAIIAHCDTVN